MRKAALQKKILKTCGVKVNEKMKKNFGEKYEKNSIA